jgi:mannosyltransferase
MSVDALSLARYRTVEVRATHLVVLLTILAAVVRFATLGDQSLWLDESYTIERISGSFAGVLHGVRVAETSPPLYFVLAWAWGKAFGTTAVGLRTLSALAGIGAVPLVYAAGAALGLRRAGVVAAALTAVSPLMVWYSQESRGYALLVALCAASLWCAGRVVSGASRRWLAGWAVAASLALATHTSPRS